MREVLRINNWVIEDTRRVDVQTTLAVWVLERSLDGDDLLSGGGRGLGETQQNLSLANAR